jgi:formiminotetrahydrofolate cyclodeaminase
MLLRKLSVEDFLKELEDDHPTPGGGSAAAFAGSMAASLALMALKISARKYVSKISEYDPLKYKKIFRNEAAKLKKLIDEDAKAYDGVLKAFKIPKNKEKLRREKIQAAYAEAARVPCETAVSARKVLWTILSLERAGVFSETVTSDIKVAKLLANAAIKGAAANIKINMVSIEDENLIVRYKLFLISLKK